MHKTFPRLRQCQRHPRHPRHLSCSLGSCRLAWSLSLGTSPASVVRAPMCSRWGYPQRNGRHQRASGSDDPAIATARTNQISHRGHCSLQTRLRRRACSNSSSFRTSPRISLPDALYPRFDTREDALFWGLATWWSVPSIVPVLIIHESRIINRASIYTGLVPAVCTAALPLPRPLQPYSSGSIPEPPPCRKHLILTTTANLSLVCICGSSSRETTLLMPFSHRFAHQRCRPQRFERGRGAFRAREEVHGQWHRRSTI